MLQIAIVEDEKKMADILSDYLEKFTLRTGEAFQINRFENAIRFLNSYRSAYDIILMDIDLPGLNGMEAAKRLRERDTTTPLIFITNMAQFAVKGYEVGALDYIVKPVAYPDFELKFGRAVQSVKNHAESIFILLPGETRRVLLRDICYIEVCGHNLIYHTVQESFTAGGSLQEVEEKLGKKGFLRGNKGYLVNQTHIQRIQGDQLFLTGNQQLTLSRLRKKAFMGELAQYMGDGNIL